MQKKIILKWLYLSDYWMIEKKTHWGLTVYANTKMFTDMNMRCTQTLSTTSVLSISALRLQMVGFNAETSSASSHLSPLSHLFVSLCFSIWGNGTLEQPSVAKRLKSGSFRQWTTCGSSWRRPIITLCWQLDICACETYTEIHKEEKLM